MSALDGIRVLDLTRLLPGAAATARFVENGAEVIKIEQPGTGDYARALSPRVFAMTNGGKKSVAIDLKNTRGRDLLLSMAERADVLIESFRPGAMARLGLGYETVRERNRRLIYASLTGYGQTGPYADLAGHDINYLALGGVLALNLPVIPGVQIADLAGGAMQTIIAVLMALLEREKTGAGAHLDISMTAGVQSLLTIPLATCETLGRDPKPGDELLSGRYACYNLYRTSDDRSIAVGALEPKFWAELCGRLGCDDLVPLQFAEGATQADVKARIAALFATRTAEEWFTMLRDSDCCVTPVRLVSEIAYELRGICLQPPPWLGEHTKCVLSGCGITDEEFERLAREGAIQ